MWALRGKAAESPEMFLSLSLAHIMHTHVYEKNKHMHQPLLGLVKTAELQINRKTLNGGKSKIEKKMLNKQ